VNAGNLINNHGILIFAKTACIPTTEPCVVVSARSRAPDEAPADRTHTLPRHALQSAQENAGEKQSLT